METKMTYKGSGVNYEAMDPFKLLCQKAGLETAHTLTRFPGVKEYEQSRGESAYLIELPDFFLAHVEEGLGTKNLVADAMLGEERSYYDAIARDTVAMIVNDMITLGALPLSVAMHLAVGDSSWFDNDKRIKDLVDGWKKACILSRCAWGGGETPTLKDIIYPDTAVLSGSAMGIIWDKKNLIDGSRIKHGDQIIFFSSSGVHANGLTLARKITEKLPEGYSSKATRGGSSYGELLLEPTVIYTPLIDDCQKMGIDIHYAVHVTGHGWRKLMRANGSFSYVITDLPPLPTVFSFLQEHGGIEDREMYGTYNMGVGFALYVSKSDVPRVFDLHASAGYKEKYGMEIRIGGHIEQSFEKKVIIQPKNLEFSSEDLKVR